MIDGQLTGSGTADALGEMVGGQDIKIVNAAERVGNTSLGFNMTAYSMHLDYVVARRGPVLIEVVVLHPDDQQPLVDVVDLAAILDERVIAVVGTGSEGFRSAGPLVPELTTYIPTPLDVSPEPKVIGTNLLLAALLMLPFAVAAELFTRTIAGNEELLRRRFKPVEWLARLQERLTRGVGSRLHQPALRDIGKLLGVMFFYGLAFSLLDRTWNPFSLQGLVLFFSMTIAYGIVGVADDILQWRAIRGWGLEADLTVRPTNVLLAAVSTTTSRLLSLVPGLMFGTPEALHTDESQFDQEKKNRLLKISAVTFISIGLIVWLPTVVTTLLQRLSLPEALSNLLGGLEASLLVIFAVALENTFVQMLGFPGGFGQALKRRNRWLWIGGLVAVAFIFFHILLNPRGELAEALEEGNVQILLIVAAVFVVVSFGLWLFLGRGRRAEVTEAASPTPSRAARLPAAPPIPAAVVAELAAIPVPEARLEVISGETKPCPNCGEMIKAQARICRFCRATFAVTAKGYCLNCHEITLVNEEGNCQRCGKQVADIHVESKMLTAPPKPAVAPVKPAAPAPAAAVTEAKGDSKQCPACGQTIKAAARVCRFCRAHFEVNIKGYCRNCRGVVEVADDKCARCGGEVIDIHIDSQMVGAPETAKAIKAETKSYKEKDNLGTRHDTESIATSYWVARIQSPKKEPFVLHMFDTEEDARQALLELPCIHAAEDTGNLICTEVLIFGYYPTSEKKYEAILCGNELSHELWAQAKASFIKHGGRLRGEGEQEPEKRAAPAKKAKASKPSKVVFVREDRQFKHGATFIYRVFKSPDAASAKAFLEQNPVTERLYYIVVETPEGNYCRDVQGIYKE
jgi:arginine exporter protein ArgO